MAQDEVTQGIPRGSLPPGATRTGELRPGERFADRYEVLERIGTGAYGAVYRAKDVSLHRVVALKVLRVEILHPKTFTEDRARFVREATTAANLTHPHIATVYDAGESGGLPYIAMECVEGKSLREILDKERALPVRRAVDIARQVVSTLAYAHARGVIHRDVKPANILLAMGGQVKIADFGLAKTYLRADGRDEASAPPLTGEGAIVGTLQYLSPEYIRGDKVDDRSDVYAAGVVLYEMLAGAPPFDSANITDILRKHLEEEPRPLQEAGRGAVPAPLAALVHRMLAKSRAERPTAEAASKELDRAQALLADEASKTLIIQPPTSGPGAAPSEAPSMPVAPQTEAVVSSPGAAAGEREGETPRTEVLPPDAAAEALPKDPYVGRVIRDCKILEILGEGGMGAVYKARHLQLGAFRAVKVIRKELASQPGFYDRFRNEALLAEGLTHPNLVTLYDFSRLEDGSLYMLWEYVEGENLEERLKKKGKFTPRETARILYEALGGLAVAHKRGIVHRDLALDNIMLVKGDDRAEHVKLIDFGIAKSLRPVAMREGTDTHPATEAGVFVGKVGYSSPEQLGDLRKGEELDFRVDIYSVGAVMFRMLTAKFPFDASSMTSYLRDAAMTTPDKLRARLPAGTPTALADVIVKCLAVDRTQRFQSVEALMDSLRKANLDAALPFAAPSRVHRAWLMAFFAAVALLAVDLSHRAGWLDFDFGKDGESALLAGAEYRRLAEEAFSARRYIEPAEQSALHWAGLASEAEKSGAYADEMKRRIAAELLKHARTLLMSVSRDALAEAQKMFQRVLGLRPGEDEARFGFLVSEGALTLTDGDADGALSILEEAKNINPLSPELRFWLARVYRALSDRAAQAGDMAEAKRHKSEAVFLDPALEEKDFRLAEIEAAQKAGALKPAPAREEKIAAAKPAPPPPAVPKPATASDDPAFYNEKGNRLFAEKRYAEAEEQYRLALRHAGGSAALEVPVQMNLANLFFSQRKYAQAKPHYERALALDNRRHSAHFYLGKIALEGGRAAEAERLLREAVVLAPNEAKYHFDLGNALHDQGKTADAERAYARAQELGFADGATLHNQLGNIYMELRRPKDAAAQYEKAAALAAGDAAVHFNLGLAYMDLKKHDAARASFERTVGINPSYAGAHFQLGVLESQEKRYAEAKFRFEKAIQAKPDYGMAYYNLSQIMAALGDDAAAQSYRQTACKYGVQTACR